MPSELLKRIVISVLVFCWTLFAAEMFLRVFDPQPMLPRYIQAGDFGIRVNMPNQCIVHQTAEYRVDICTNSKGMRANREFTYEKPVNVKRIVVLSDSFGMGYGVSFEESFTEQMRRGLEAKLGQPVEIINLSVSGYGTAEELLMLQQEGVKYHPDLVLLTWHSSDLDDNVRAGLFALEGGHLVRKHASYLPGVKIREFLFRFAVYRWLAGNSHLYNWIRHQMSNAIKQLMVLSVGNGKSGMADSVQTQQQKVRLAIALLDTIRVTAEQAGANLLLLEIPIDASRTEFIPSMPDEIRRRFDVISPVEIFKQYPGDMLYWERSQGHFTPLGCKLTGMKLVRKITSENLMR